MAVTLLMLSVFTYIMSFTLSSEYTREDIERIIRDMTPKNCTFLTFGQDEAYWTDYIKYNFDVPVTNKVQSRFTYHCPPALLDDIKSKSSRSRLYKVTDYTAGGSCCYGITRKPYCCSSSVLNSMLWIGFVLLLLGLIAAVAYFAYQNWDSIKNLSR